MERTLSTPAHQQTREIGTSSGLVFLRVMEILLLLVFIPVAVVCFFSGYSWAALATLAIVFSIVAKAHSALAISANHDGLQVQRYFSSTFVPWTDVAEVKFGGHLSYSGLSFRFSRSVQGSKAGSVLSPVWVHEDVRAIWKQIRHHDRPEIVSWLMQKFEQSKANSSVDQR
jgi:hypothetical protein